MTATRLYSGSLRYVIVDVVQYINWYDRQPVSPTYSTYILHCDCSDFVLSCSSYIPSSHLCALFSVYTVPSLSIGSLKICHFLPQDVMHKRGLCCRVAAGLVAGSVGGWGSVTFVYCVDTAKDTAIVAIQNVDRKPYPCFWMVLFSLTLERPLGDIWKF